MVPVPSVVLRKPLTPGIEVPPLVLLLPLAALAGTIRGRVADARTGEPLVGAVVHLQGTSHNAQVQLDGTLARVLAHLDLPPDENCARFHERESRVRTASRAQVRQPVNARGLGRWRAYAAELAPLIAELEAMGG